MESNLEAELADALSRGRLCIADGCAMSEAERDALFELGAEKLDLGLVPDAVTVFRGLVALYPYCGRYYLALGVALMASNAFADALIALRCAVRMQPELPFAQLLLVQNHLLMGDGESALDALEAIDDATLECPEHVERHAVLKGCLRDQKRAPKTQTQSEKDQRAEPTHVFQLPDGRPLPLSPSRFEKTEPMIALPSTEKTERVRARVPEPLKEDITVTAVVRRRRGQAAASSPKEVTHTAVVVRRNLSQKRSREDTALSYFTPLAQEE